MLLRVFFVFCAWFSILSTKGQNTGQTDPTLKEILTFNPQIRILGSPWSPPVWMKDNGSSVGGSLQPQYYGAYANYFV